MLKVLLKEKIWGKLYCEVCQAITVCWRERLNGDRAFLSHTCSFVQRMHLTAHSIGYTSTTQNIGRNILWYSQIVNIFVHRFRFFNFPFINRNVLWFSMDIDQKDSWNYVINIDITDTNTRRYWFEPNLCYGHRLHLKLHT